MAHGRKKRHVIIQTLFIEKTISKNGIRQVKTL